MLGKRRDNEHEVSVQIKTEFMQLWDGLTTDRHAGVLVLAATNRPGELDEAVLRRFSHQYEVRSVHWWGRGVRVGIACNAVLASAQDWRTHGWRQVVSPFEALVRFTARREASIVETVGTLLRSSSGCPQVPLPDEGQREAILRLILSKHAAEGVQPLVDPQLLSHQPSDAAQPLRAIAHGCAGFSGSDLAELCSQAVSIPVHDALAAHRAGRTPSGIEPVSLAHFQTVLGTFRPATQLANPQATDRQSESEQLIRLLLLAAEQQRQPQQQPDEPVPPDNNGTNGKTSS